MQIPIFGILYMGLSLLFCLNRKWFIYWYVLGNSLFYTTIIAIGTHTSIKPFHFNTLLMFIFFVRGKLFDRKIFKGLDVLLLISFFVWLVICFIFSFYLPNGLLVLGNSNAFKGVDALVPLQPSISDLSQLAFPLFGIFAFFVLTAFMRTQEDIKLFTRAFLWSFIPLALTVMFLFVLRNVTHSGVLLQAFFRFINVLYDRDVSDNAYNSLGDISRTFTYIGEASYTAKYYLLMMSIFITLLIYKKYSIYKKYLLIGLILFQFLLIIILGSTTAYVGFCILMCIIGYLYLRYQNRFSKKTVMSNLNFLGTNFFFLFLIGVPLCLMFLDQIIFFFNYVQETHIDKLEAAAGSGENRLNSILAGLDVFFQSPIFGVGYGKNRSNSYMIFLLSDTGLIGFALLNLFCYHLIIAPLKRLNRMPKDMRVYCLIYVTIFSSAWVIYFSFASNVAILFGWFWTIAAILAKFTTLDRLKFNEPANEEIETEPAPLKKPSYGAIQLQA